MNFVKIGPDRDFLPIQHKAFTQTNADVLSIRPLGT